MGIRNVTKHLADPGDVKKELNEDGPFTPLCFRATGQMIVADPVSAP